MTDWTLIQPPSVGADATPQDPELAPSINTTTSTVTTNGAPYLPTTAQVGGVPSPAVDDPICAVLAFLFLIATAAHMAIFQINKRRDHLFVFSAMMFAFSLIRALALILRIAWASYSTNARLAIAANVLTQAGTVLVFIINLFFAQRILRGYHPKFGWSKPAGILFKFLFASVVLSLLMVIITTTQSFFTLDETTREADRRVQLFGSTYLAILAFLPIPIVTLAAIIPRQYVVEKFGTGSWRAKMFLLLFTASLMTLGAGFRMGTNYSPRPIADPAWYHSRGPYYAFNYVLDLIVTYVYLSISFHKRFHIPNGAKGPGSYRGVLPTEKSKYTQRSPRRGSAGRTFHSAETLTTHFGPAPSPTVHSSKLPIGYVGYNDSVSSFKNAPHRKPQRHRLSKTTIRRSNASLGSQDTFVGSTSPSVTDVAPSLPSLYRGVAGQDRGLGMPLRYSELSMSGAESSTLPPALPPVPVMPAAVESMYGTSREGTIYEEPYAGASESAESSSIRYAEGPNNNADSVKRSSDVLSDMLEKMGSVRDSVDSFRGGHKRGSAERTSNGLRMWGSRDFEMSGAGIYRAELEGESKRVPSASSSRYDVEFDGFDGPNNGERSSRQS
ncbi:hypothetical protein SCARD494_12668 [Seiridium cardinale]